MDRLACINVPSLPLQIALRRFPEGDPRPVVLIRRDRPTSPILQLNRAARAQGLRPGMRYSEALSLVAGLQAVLVSAEDLAAAQREILGILEHWSPRIEVCPFETGSFWVDAGGLTGLYGSEARWGAGLRRALAEKRYQAVIVVGTTRGGTYVVARSRRRSAVVKSLEAELRVRDEAPLSLVPLALRHRRLLERLGVKTLSALAGVPRDALARRFGLELVRDLESLDARADLPIQDQPSPEPWNVSRRLEPPVADRQALLPLVGELLETALGPLRHRSRLAAQLRLVFLLDSGELRSEVLRPADPTARLETWIRLLALRLERCDFSSGVAELRLAVVDVPAPSTTQELFDPPPLRDLRRGAEALALIRAQWGNDAVVHAVLADSHVPELSYRWEVVEGLSPPAPGPPQAPFPTAVRRVSLEGPPGEGNPSGERLGGPCRLRVASVPPVDKEYWFLRNGRGEVAWVSWDRLAQKPRWEGMVD